MTIQEMIARQQAIVSGARAAGRDLTAEERAEFDGLQRQIDAAGNNPAQGAEGQGGEDPTGGARGMGNDNGQQDFNPRAPCGARQQKYIKLLYTLLRQKAILRQFHAKRRLLKRFSTYKYRNTFLICSANRMGKICTLPLRTTRSLDLPEGMPACNQSARFCFRTFFPSSKTADYPAPDP